jgi:putative SOS response-associated peptidase YedK
MSWGFSFRTKTMAPTSKPIPVYNIGNLEKPMWKRCAEKPSARCPIPLTGFAEAEGPKGAIPCQNLNMNGWPELESG